MTLCSFQHLRLECHMTLIYLNIGWLLDHVAKFSTLESSFSLCSSVVYNAEKAMAPDSSTLAWKIPWMEQPGRLQSMGLWRVGHNWATALSLFTFMHWRRKWQPTPGFLPGESQGWGSLVGCRLWVTQSRTWLKLLSSSSSSWNSIASTTFVHSDVF